MNASLVYSALFLVAVLPWVSTAGALLLGLFVCLGLTIPIPAGFRKLGKILLQASIIALGFAMDPQAVWRAGTSGVAITALSLAITLGAGWAIARWLGVARRLGALITIGTAICGGSAIAAAGPVLGADNDEMAVSLAVVFLLNAVALVLFPPIGSALGLSPESFGLFSAIAIHDTSSVVGAAAAFSPISVPIAVTVKLTRALWILPLTFALAFFTPRAEAGGKRAPFPWFILGFIGAVLLRAAFPHFQDFYAASGEIGKAGLKGAIFLISAQMTRASLRRVGARPLLLAVLLWMVVIAATLALVQTGLITYGG